MTSNRRNWLRQVGLGAAGFSLSAFTRPVQEELPLTIPDVPRQIRLIANENPYGPSPMARKAMAEAITLGNRYNGELTNVLKADLAQHHGLAAENLLVTAGSTQVLDMMAMYVALEKGNCVAPQPTFDYWTFCAEKNGARRIEVQTTPEKKLDFTKILPAIEANTKVVYICNPNNPTGTLCNRNELIDFIEAASKKTMVLVDEAYLDFTTQPSVCNLVQQNKNLVVAKTFSKIYGLAGARIGYALAHPDTIKKLSDLTSWPNGSHSVVSTAAAIASLKDHNFVRQTYTHIQQSREYTQMEMRKLGIPCIDSNTNFIYFSLAGYSKDFFEQLKNNHILGTRIYEEEGKWSRITIGTQKEMELFIKSIA